MIEPLNYLANDLASASSRFFFVSPLRDRVAEIEARAICASLVIRVRQERTRASLHTSPGT
jgi:hypothetical protein